MSYARLKINPCRIMECKRRKHYEWRTTYHFFGKRYASDKVLSELCCVPRKGFIELDKVSLSEIPRVLAGGYMDTEYMVRLLGGISTYWGHKIALHRANLYIVPGLKEMALPYLLARLQEGK